MRDADACNCKSKIESGVYEREEKVEWEKEEGREKIYCRCKMYTTAGYGFYLGARLSVCVRVFE